MNIENEHIEEENQEQDAENSTQRILEKFDEMHGPESEENTAPEPEPEAEEPAPNDTDVSDDDDKIPSDDTDDSGTRDQGDDDSVPDDGGDEEDDFDEEAFRQDFANRYGFDSEYVSRFDVDQLEMMGRQWDERELSRLNAQQPQAPQQPQQFQQPMPQQQFPQNPPQQFPQQQMPFQQPQPQQPPAMDFNQLRQMAENEGYDPQFVESLQAIEQRNQQLNQQLQAFQQNQFQQEQARNQQIVNEFDKSLDSLEMTNVFGENRNSAQTNPVQWQARVALFDEAQLFAQSRGEPLTPDLVKRVASVRYPDQFRSKQQKKITKKAREQHHKKLGSGQVRSSKPGKKVNPDLEGMDPEVGRILSNPQVAAIFDEAGM